MEPTVRRIARAAVLVVAQVGLLTGAQDAVAAPGDLDPGFSQDGKQTLELGPPANTVEDVAIDDAGRVLLAGSSGAGTSTGDLAVARLLADGSLDPQFGAGGIFHMDLGSIESATAVAPGPGGGTYAALNSRPVEGELSVLRLGPNGLPDPAFSGDGLATTPVDGASATARDLAPTPDGGVIVAGTAGSGAEEDIALARFGPDGALDPALGGDGTVRSDLGKKESASALAIDSGGRMVVGGRSEVSEPLIARYLPSGALDSSFSDDGLAKAAAYTRDGFTDLAILADGRIVAAGTGYNSIIVRFGPTLVMWTYTPSGEVTTSGTTDGIALGGIAAQPDGGLALAYTFDSSGRGGSTPQDFVLDRLLSNGQADPGFGSGAREAVVTDFDRTANAARALAMGPDGRFVVAGLVTYFSQSGGTSQKIGVARYLNSPGPRDPDADGVLGDSDRCGRSFGPQDPAGCEHLERGVSLSADPRRGPKRAFVLRGELTDACFAVVKVRVRRRQRGRDAVAGTDTTNFNGDFSVRGLMRPGRYYAEVGDAFYALGMCDAERSRIVRVR